MRYFIRLQYKGTAYHGWQIQPNAPSVQQTLQEAFQRLIKEPVELVGCGRTDTGVHARDFYAHLDLTEPISDCAALLRKLESMRLQGILVKEIFPVADTLHARFTATSRTYEYWIMPRRDPFLEGLAYHVFGQLNLEAMNEAASLLLGKQDFEAFSKTHTQVMTNNCEVKQASWEMKDEKLVFTITADRFLRNMVRAIVGTLLEVGHGKIEPAEISRILASGSRSEAGSSVPACGLYLTRIEYPWNEHPLP